MNNIHHPIPVIDIFAGPGGLGEGFSSLTDEYGNRCFRIVLSIEKEKFAHRTLELRAFFREFSKDTPKEYYEYLKGNITRDELFQTYPVQAAKAQEIAWHAELGKNDEFPSELIDQRICNALDGAGTWVLIGGPPCQAYSVIGKARIQGSDPSQYENDSRHFLYKEYLRIITVHQPSVFILENVQGIISTTVKGMRIFQEIIRDLQTPYLTLDSANETTHCTHDTLGYRLYSPTKPVSTEMNPTDFVVNMEKYGIPQKRKRVIIVGIRDNILKRPKILKSRKTLIPVKRVIEDLPKIRSSISGREKEVKSWLTVIKEFKESEWINDSRINSDLRNLIIRKIKYIRNHIQQGGRFVPARVGPKYHPSWYIDKKLGGACIVVDFGAIPRFSITPPF